MSRRNEAWRAPLWKRLQLALSVLRGRQSWADGYPTPWAYEQVCETLRRERQPCERPARASEVAS